MAWTDVDLYNVNQLIDGSAMDALRGNIEYLHAPNYAEYRHPGTGSNYTVTGDLGQDIDSTNFNLDLTTYGGMVMACFYGQWMLDGATRSIRANIVRTDAISHLGVNLFNDFAIEIASVLPAGDGRGWVQMFPDVPAGTHEFRAIWGASSGTGTLFVVNRPYMAVWEI